MKIFVAALRKKNNSDFFAENIKSKIKSIVESKFPVVKTDVLSSEVWVNNQNSICVSVFSNEGPVGLNDRPLIDILDSDRVAIKLGYSDKSCVEIFNNDGVARLDIVKGASGQFAFVGIDSVGIDLITDSVGSIPFYTTELDDCYIISNRINVVAGLKIDLTGALVDHDLLACRDFALQGHYLDRRTGYLGIDSTSVHEHTRISFRGLRRESWLDKGFNEIDFNSIEYKNLVRSVSESLVNAMLPLNGGDVHLSITGGRDSRLLAAILSNLSNVNVVTATSGIDANPDVILGKLISEKLGWPHKVIAPKIIDSVVMVEDPVQRVLRTLDVHDGSTSAWDDCPDYGDYSLKPTMSGVGGEILRGGMTLISKEFLVAGEARSILTNTMCGGGFFTKDVQLAAIESARPLLMKAVYNQHAALDEYYHVHRNHRWVCNRRNGARLRWNIFDPLLDNKVVSHALAISPTQRWTERLVFDVIAHLNPVLRDIPIEGERWRFERSNQLVGHESNWDDRFALKSTKEVKRQDWRNMSDPKLRLSINELILDGARSYCSDLFNFTLLEEYVKGAKYSTTIWHILTLVLFMSRLNSDARSHRKDNYIVNI